jgi:NADH dehydrogenase
MLASHLAANDALARRALPTREGTPPRVVVLGGGYAGVLAANRLVGRLGRLGMRRAEVTLIEERDELVHRVRLHEVVARGPGKLYPLDEMLHRRVRRIEGRAARIDADARVVAMKDGDAVPFDHLVVAVGSRPSGAIPGALRHGGAIAGPEAARAAHAQLESLAPGERVVVIGGGLSGVELATEIAEAHPRLDVVLVADVVLPGVSDGARVYAERVLAELGVDLRRGKAVAIDASGALLQGGVRIDAALVVWAGGFAPAGPSIASDLARDAQGRFLVDASLRAIGHDAIWIAGDAAAPPPGLPFARMSCALAMPMGAHAADGVVRAIRGEAQAPFRFGYAGQCISLGRKRALVQMVDAEDRPRDRFLSGRMGAVVKELICTYVTGSIRVERRFGGAYTWPRKIEAREDEPAASAMAHAAPLGA